MQINAILLFRTLLGRLRQKAACKIAETNRYTKQDIRCQLTYQDMAVDIEIRCLDP